MMKKVGRNKILKQRELNFEEFYGESGGLNFDYENKLCELAST